ncbi:Glyoxalase/Bleomycin resistance protein/Dihydroxybiphenyl dioxygenase [Trichoderma austrokoningii]
MSALAAVKSVDHIVLTCASIPRTVAWYSKYLGMKEDVFATPDTQRVALKFGTQKINLHQQGKEFEPKALTALPGTADLCFLVEDGVDLDEVRRGFARDGVEVLEGGEVVARTGAMGEMRSIYVRDPDGNLIELSQYETA